LRIVSCLLSIVLFGVAAVGASLAEEAGPGARDVGNVPNLPADTSGSQHSSAGKGGEGAAKFDGPAQAHGTGDDVRGGSEESPVDLGRAANGPGVSGSGDRGDHAIDTRIGMPSRRLDGSRGRIENVKARVRLLAPRRPSTPGPLEQGVRNAIGVSVGPHGGQERREAQHSVVPNIGPKSPAASAGANTKAGDQRPALVPAEAGPGISPSVPKRGMISGTGAMHPGGSQQGIGGPAKTIAGISGSAVHSKH